MAALLSHAKSVLGELRNCTRWPSPFRFVSFLLCHIVKLMTIISRETVLPFPRPHNPNNKPNFQLFRYDLHCKLNSAKCLTWLKTSAFLPLGINLVSGTPTPYYHVIQHTEPKRQSPTVSSSSLNCTCIPVKLLKCMTGISALKLVERHLVILSKGRGLTGICHKPSFY